MAIDPKTSEGLNTFQSFASFYTRLISITNSIGSIWIFDELSFAHLAALLPPFAFPVEYTTILKFITVVV